MELIIIGLASLTHLWIVSEPTIWLRSLCGLSELNYDTMSKYKRTIYRFLTCHLCIGFWIGLLTQNILMAAIVSVVAVLIEKITRPSL
jgi:hypothetical protein